MARPIHVDRVVETTQTTGTGTLDLDGPQTGYRSFIQEVSSGSRVYYTLADSVSAPTQYEVGIGTITSGSPNTLSRDTVITSSNSGSKISLGALATYVVTGTLVASTVNVIGDAIESDHDTTGSSNAYILTILRDLSVIPLYEGMLVGAVANHTCTGASTLNVNAGGGIEMKRPDGSPLQRGDIMSGEFFLWRYSSSAWTLLNPTRQSVNATAATLSGSRNKLFSVVPDWATQVDLLIHEMSTNVAASALAPYVQLGPAGSLADSGYTGTVASPADASATQFSTSFQLLHANAENAKWTGTVTFKLLDPATNRWIMSGRLGRTDSAVGAHKFDGSVALSGPLDQVYVFLPSGPGAFDDGTVNLLFT